MNTTNTNNSNINTSLSVKQILLKDDTNTSHSKITISSYDIVFPYQPYDNQITYMQKVIESLSNRHIAALESPTGTGKTLCLLCAALGFLKKQRSMGKNYRIYYTTRTHSQISNVIQELNKTLYKPTTAILTSRDNACINRELQNDKGVLLNIKCKLAKKGRCEYYKKIGMYSDYDRRFNNYDIEEIKTSCMTHRICPYYLCKEKARTADIVFMPYNYVFDPFIRKAFDLSFKNVIIIVDEAHNIDSTCETVMSCSINEKDLNTILQDIHQIKKELQNEQETDEATFKHFIAHEMRCSVNEVDLNLSNEVRIIENIKLMLMKVNVDPYVKLGGKILNNNELKQLFRMISEGQSNIETFISKNKSNVFKNLSSMNEKNLSQHIAFLNKIEEGIESVFGKTTKITTYIRVLNLIERVLQQQTSNDFVVYVSDSQDDNTPQSYALYQHDLQKLPSNKPIRTINFYCFNPGLGFDLVCKLNPLSIILTSGTLSPISGLESELGRTFETSLANSHVVRSSQIKFTLITASQHPNGKTFPFDLRYQNKEEASTLRELGNTILKLISVTPGGVLVFFTSYSHMNKCYNNWNTSKLIEQMEQYKTIIKDTNDTKKSKVLLRKYMEHNRKSNIKMKGAVLLSVCRSSTSEGIDFTDDCARLVVVIGIPFANLSDERVHLKKQYLDNKPKGDKGLSGSEWYTQDAMRTVNQSLGRVIRHIYDYGAIVVIDWRYREMSRKMLFSKWLRDKVEVEVCNEQYVEGLKQFYVVAKKEVEEKKRVDVNIEKEKRKKVEIQYERNNVENDNNNAQCLENWNKFIKEHKFNNEDENTKLNANYLNNETININTTENKREMVLSPSSSVSDGEDVSNINSNVITNNNSGDSNNDLSNLLKHKTKRTQLSSFIDGRTISIKKIKSFPTHPNFKQVQHNNNSPKQNTDAGTNNNSKGQTTLLNFITPNMNSNDNDNTKQTTKESNDNIIQQLMNIKAKAKEIQDQYNLTDMERECEICYFKRDKHDFSKSKCGHVVCNPCWNNWLKEKLECPLCKKKVRAKTLEPLIH